MKTSSKRFYSAEDRDSHSNVENMTSEKEAKAAVSAKSGVSSEFYSSSGRGGLQEQKKISCKLIQAREQMIRDTNAFAYVRGK